MLAQGRAVDRQSRTHVTPASHRLERRRLQHVGIARCVDRKLIRYFADGVDPERGEAAARVKSPIRTTLDDDLHGSGVPVLHQAEFLDLRRIRSDRQSSRSVETRAPGPVAAVRARPKKASAARSKVGKRNHAAALGSERAC